MFVDCRIVKLKAIKLKNTHFFRWIGWSLLTGVLAAILCLGTQNDGWVPINKNLWSISFVMVTSCFAFLLLSLLYIIIDIKKWWKGQPFFYAGMNSILLYCGHSVGYNLFPFHFMIGMII